MQRPFRVVSVLILFALSSSLGFAQAGATGNTDLPSSAADMLNGITLMANNGKYVGLRGSRLKADRDQLDQAERFDVQAFDDGTVSVRCQGNDELLTTGNGRAPVGCMRVKDGRNQRFRIEPIGQDGSTLALLCSNGKYLTSENGRKPMTCSGHTAGSRETFTYMGGSVVTPPDPDGGPDAPASGQTLIIGNFSILDDADAPAPSLHGRFFVASDEADFQDSFKLATSGESSGDDTCEVTVFDATPTQPPVQYPTTLDAGEVLIASSPTGTYAEITRYDEYIQTGPDSYLGPIIQYRVVGDNLVRPVPENLTLDIPGGDVVPTISALPFPGVQAIELLEPAPATNIQATPATVYRWVAGSDPDASVEISVLNQELLLTCSARDDGEFVVPQSTAEVLGAQFVGRFYRIVRVVNSVVFPEENVGIKLSHINGYNSFR